MATVSTKVGHDGNVLIPDVLRKELGLASYDELVVSRNKDGVQSSSPSTCLSFQESGIQKPSQKAARMLD